VWGYDENRADTTGIGTLVRTGTRTAQVHTAMYGPGWANQKEDTICMTFLLNFSLQLHTRELSTSTWNRNTHHQFDTRTSTTMNMINQHIRFEKKLLLLSFTYIFFDTVPFIGIQHRVMNAKSRNIHY
jgi:hypothetical protein